MTQFLTPTRIPYPQKMRIKFCCDKIKKCGERERKRSFALESIHQNCISAIDSIKSRFLIELPMPYRSSVEVFNKLILAS